MFDNMTDEEKKKFLIRFICFIVIGFLGPISYLIGRYNLFQPTSGTQIGLWGVIVFGILIALAGTLIWYYLQAMKTKYSFAKQIIHGILKVILPLMFAALLLTWFKDNIDLVIETLWVFMCFELVAIPLNPLPEWAFKNNVEGISVIAKKIHDELVPNRPSGKETPKASENPTEESK